MMRNRIIKIAAFCAGIFTLLGLAACKNEANGDPVQNQSQDVVISIYEGESKVLKTTASVKVDIVWSSSNENIVRVEQDGRITALAVGTADIVASYNGSTIIYKVTVNALDFIIDGAEEADYCVSLSNSSMMAVQGGTISVQAGVQVGGELVDELVEWNVALQSSTEEVPYVVEGNSISIQLDNIGSYLVTATKGSSTASCLITCYAVTAKELPFTPVMTGKGFEWEAIDGVIDYLVSIDGGSTWSSLGKDAIQYVFDNPELKEYSCVFKAKGDGVTYFDSASSKYTYRPEMYFVYENNGFQFIAYTEGDYTYDVYVNGAVAISNTTETTFNRVSLGVLYGTYQVQVKAKLNGEVVSESNILDLTFKNKNTAFNDLTATKFNEHTPIEATGLDADGDGKYWEVMSSGLNGIGYHLIVLSGTTDFDREWCPKGLFGSNQYSRYADRYIGMYVKVSETVTFTLGGMAGNWTTGSVATSSQTVTPEDGWKYIEFNLAELESMYQYFTGILTNGVATTVLVDNVQVLEEPLL